MSPQLEPAMPTSFSRIALGALLVTGAAVIPLVWSRTQPQLAVRLTTPFQDHVLPDTLRVKPVGRPSAPVTMVVFTNYTCEACRQLFDSILPFVREGRVKVYWRQHPRKENGFSTQASLLSICARMEQAYDEYSEVLYRNPNAVIPFQRGNASVLDRMPRTSEVRDCLVRKAAESELLDDNADGIRLNVVGTPTIFLGGVRQDGYSPKLTRTLRQLARHAASQ